MRPGFDPWVGRIPWRTERLPTPIFWPREVHGLYSPWGAVRHDWATFTFPGVTLHTGALHHIGLATWLVLTNEMLVDVRHTQAGNVPMNLALLPCMKDQAHCSQCSFRTRHTGQITCPGWSRETRLGIKLKPEVQLRGSWPTDLWAWECIALRLSVWGKFCYPALLRQELTNTQDALVVWGAGSYWRM